MIKVGSKLSAVRDNLQYMGQTATDWWLSRPRLDTWLVALVVGIHLTLYWTRDVGPLLESIPATRRPALYAAAAVVVSLTGTLSTLGVGQYLNNRGERVNALKRAYPDVLGRTWRGAFLGTGLAAALFLLAFALDSRRGPNSLGMWVFELAFAIALLRFVRLSILFSKIIDLVVKDDLQPITPSNEGINLAMFEAPTARQ